MEHCSYYFLNISVPWSAFCIFMLLLGKTFQFLKKAATFQVDELARR